MEAKDTVMSERELRTNCYEATKKQEITERGLQTVNMVAQVQAEISFKAGIREVVEFIDKTFTKTITIDQMMATNTWQAELEEWEVSND